MKPTKDQLKAVEEALCAFSWAEIDNIIELLQAKGKRNRAEWKQNIKCFEKSRCLHEVFMVLEDGTQRCLFCGKEAKP